MYPYKTTLVKLIFGIPFGLSISIIALIFFFLVWESFPILINQPWKFFTDTNWQPGKTYGALGILYGTLLVTALAILFALPLGVMTAIVTSEFLTVFQRLFLKSLLELLAGIPGVVYGLLGILYLTPWIQTTFGLADGHSIFNAGMLLGIMILPMIMTLTDDSLQSVPTEYREQAHALGLTKAETILHAVLPNALHGIAGGVLLALSRAMGETIAVMMVIGSIDQLPQPLYNLFAPSQTITSKLGREAAEAIGTPSHWSALIALSLMLFLLVMALTFIGQYAFEYRKKKMLYTSQQS